MRKKSLVIIMLIIGVVIFSGVIRPFSLVQISKPEQVSGKTAIQACQDYITEYVLAYSKYGVSFPIASCIDCPKAYKVTPPVCYIGRGDTCPSDSDCRYPPLDSNAVTCGGGLTCSIRFWQSDYQGCHSGKTEASYVAYVIQSDEVGTQTESDAQNYVLEQCGPIVITTVEGSTKPGSAPPQPNTQPPQKPPVVFSCQNTCSTTQYLNLSNCVCVNAANAPVSVFQQIIDFILGILRSFGVIV